MVYLEFPSGASYTNGRQSGNAKSETLDKKTPWILVRKRTIPTATCWRNLVPAFADRGVLRGKRVNLKFIEGSRYFSFK
jgi:hypothetical protein